MKTRFVVFGLLLLLATIVVASPTETVDCQFTLELANQTGKPVAKFAKNLYEKITSLNPDENVVFSPVSIALALALVESGSAGQTQIELKSVLAPTGFNGDVSTLYQSLQHQLKIQDEKVKLTVANGLFYDNDYNLKAEYLNKMKKCFETAIEKVNFAQAEAARQKINDWISNATAQKIPELIPPAVLGPSTKAVLANAIYLKAAWANPFRSTEDLKFYSLGQADKAKTVKFMVRTGSYSYGSNEDFESVELPYDSAPISMYIVKAKAANTSVQTLESKISSLKQLCSSATSQKVMVKLPRFMIRLPTDLTVILGELNLANMFTNSADFSRMDASNGLKVSKVIHEAYIKVNENGTEAAAATAVTMIVKMSLDRDPPVMPVPFIADYPFLFAIVHKPTDTTLFFGKVNSVTSDDS